VKTNVLHLEYNLCIARNDIKIKVIKFEPISKMERQKKFKTYKNGEL